MKILDYEQAEGIVIEQPTDIYVLLDWCQSKMIDNKNECKGSKNIEKWDNAIFYLNRLMEQVEKDGFGNQNDVDKVINNH